MAYTAFFLVTSAVFVGIALLWYILQIVAYWRIFTKAGEAGWKSLIPIYNIYVQFRICWDVKYFWMSAVLIIAGVLLSALGGLGAMFYGIAMLIVGVIGIISLHKLSLAFGHGAGFTIGLVLLSPIFMLILGIGDSQYQGPQ